jgi:serine/threonine-protein kinase
MAIGSVIADRFRLEQVIGSGGMGIVFRATTLSDGCAVAIKFVKRERLSRSARERLLREANRSVQIQHPHVVRVYESGVTNETPFVVMELLRGNSFRGLLQEHGPLPVSQVCQLMGEACLGLREAHRRGIVHRDLTPNNLFACEQDSGRVKAKVLDFGLAKSLTPDGEYETTLGQGLLGSPAYMAPEQIRHPDRVDPRSDIWSLAVVTQELLTGRLPFSGRTHGETLARVLSDIPEPLPSASPTQLPIPDPIRVAIARCLRKDPRERFAHVDHFLAALSTGGGHTPLRTAPARDAPGGVAPDLTERSPDSTLTETHGHAPWRPDSRTGKNR